MSENKKVVLAYIYPKKNRSSAKHLLEETTLLCEACGFQVCDTLIQEKDRLDAKTGFYKGKLEELKAILAYQEASTVVFCNDLPIAIGMRLSQYLDCEIIDRTSLILHIFSLRAKTKQAKLQVELARLQYALPRQSEPEDIQTHERGGSFSNRGAGEMRSTRIKKRYQARIAQLKKELKIIAKENESAEHRRQKSALARVGIVGYTNAGKSSFMNAVLKQCKVAKKEVEAKDMLFATLDTYVRHISYQGTEFLLYDTVGFVSNLPHELIEAFQTTLKSAIDADLLVHIIDLSDEAYEEKTQVTEETLRQIHAGDIPCIRVYNKKDLVKDVVVENAISCKTGEGIQEILEQIIQRIYPSEETIQCLIPYDKIAMVMEGKKTIAMKNLEATTDGMKLELSGEKTRLIPFRKYQINC